MLIALLPCLEITRRIDSYEINKWRYHSHPHIYPHNKAVVFIKNNSSHRDVICQTRRPPVHVY